MGRVKQLKEIFATSFTDPEEWQRWFFGTVAGDRDDCVVLEHEASGRPVSGLLMQPYAFNFWHTPLPSAYLSCVATRPEARGKGKASALMLKALENAYDGGYAFAELIPASRALYGFYGRFGFSGVFYVAEERYTAVHPFEQRGTVCESSFSILTNLENGMPNCVLHSQTDYNNILADLAMDSGHQTVAARGEDGSEAILFATYNESAPGDTVLVRSLLASGTDAAETALAELRRRVGERPFTVWLPAAGEPRARLRTRAMARIVNAETVLSALAQAHPELAHTIRLTDRQISRNNGIYRIEKGTCRRLETSPPTKPDLDTDSSTLAAIIFSHPHTGEIFNLPTSRPYISMMLD